MSLCRRAWQAAGPAAGSIAVPHGVCASPHRADLASDSVTVPAESAARTTTSTARAPCVGFLVHFLNELHAVDTHKSAGDAAKPARPQRRRAEHRRARLRAPENCVGGPGSPRPGPKPPSVPAGGRIELSGSCGVQRCEFRPPEHRVADKHGEGPHVLRGPSRHAGTRWGFPFADVARTGTGQCWSTQPKVRCVLRACVALRRRCRDGYRIPMLTVRTRT